MTDCTAVNAGIDYCYDAVGRLLYETSYGRRLAFEYDAASNRTRIAHPDSTYFQYTYDALNQYTEVAILGGSTGTHRRATRISLCSRCRRPPGLRRRGDLHQL